MKVSYAYVLMGKVSIAVTQLPEVYIAQYTVMFCGSKLAIFR